MEKLTVPETVTKVSLTADNNLSELYLEARTLDLMPEISYQNLHGCKTIIDDNLLNAFLEQNYKAAEGNDNTVAAEENPEITYTVQNEGIVSNERKLRKILNTGRTSYVLPNRKRQYSGAGGRMSVRQSDRDNPLLLSGTV